MKLYSLRKHIVLFFILFSCSGFSLFSGDGNSSESGALREEKQIPQWFLSPNQNNGAFLYGVGEGDNIEDAKSQALNDAASRLRTTISSTTQTETSATNDSYQNDVSQKISSVVDDTTFNNYSVSRSSLVKFKYYVEVKIDANVFLQEKSELLTNLLFDINSRYSELNTQPSILEKRNEMKKVVDKCSEASNIILLISSLDPNSSDIKSNLSLFTKIKKEYDTLLSKIIFVLNGDARVKEVVKNALNKSGLRVGSGVGANVVEINLNNTPSYTKAYNNFLANNVLEISVESGGKAIASNIVRFSGASAISEQAAFTNSLDNLKEAIKTDGIEKTLGITN